MALISTNYALAILAVGILLAQAAGCADASSVSPEDRPTVLLYSSKKVKFTGIDAQGRPALSVYEGKRVVVKCTVVDVRLPGRSPSIAMEDATARFALAAGSLIPSNPESQTIELKFDEHGGAGPFVKGDDWIITLTEQGELVDLLPSVKVPAAEK